MYREPGELQTGLGVFRKMVLEEPLLSDPAFSGVKERRDPALMDDHLLIKKIGEPGIRKGTGKLGGNT